MSLTTQAREEMDTVLECSICLTEYTKPKQLPCLHTFCLGCLKQYCDHADDVKVPCPLCKREFTVPPCGVNTFPDNEFLTRLILQNGLQTGRQTSSECELCKSVGEEVEADSFCLECRQGMCRRCKMIHANASCSKNHKFVSIEEKPTKEELQRLMSNYCSKHSNKEIELYCCDCRMLICVLCHATCHTKHICKVIQEAVMEKKVLLENDRVNLEKVCIDRSECIKKLSGTSDNILQQTSVAEAAVKMKISNIKKLLEDYEQELLSKLAMIKKNRLKEIGSKKDSEELCYTALNSFLAYSRMVLDRGTDCEIIETSDELHRRAEELLGDQKEDTDFIYQHQLDFIESLTPSTEDIKKIVGDIVNKDVKEFHFTSPSTVQIIEHNRSVRGAAVVSDEIFVVGYWQSQVNVYDSHSLRVSRDINITDMKRPEGLAGCAYNRALYISELACIYRVDLNNNSVTRWKMRENHEPRGLSVTAEHTLLVTVEISGTRGESRVVEYTSEGQQVREIRFDRSIKWVSHTVQLSSDQFIVSHGLGLSSLHRVCVINAEGQIIKSFGREGGGGEDQLNWPQSLAIDEKSKHVFVADTMNDRVLMLDSELMTRLGEVRVSRDLSRPTHLYFDSSTDRLFVAEHDGYNNFSPRQFVVTRPELRN